MREWLSAVSRHRRQTCVTRIHPIFPVLLYHECLSVSSRHIERERKKNIAARVSGGSREMETSSFWRDFKARVDSSNELISSSIACRRWSQDSGDVSMKVIARVDMSPTLRVQTPEV